MVVNGERIALLLKLLQGTSNWSKLTWMPLYDLRNDMNQQDDWQLLYSYS